MSAGHPSVTELTLQQSHFIGPLPPPEQLAQYDQIAPGFADRIIAMAEKEQNERHFDARAPITPG